MCQGKCVDGVSEEDDRHLRKTSSFVPLPWKELSFYVILQITVLAWFVYSIYRESIDRSPWLQSYLQEGWPLLGRKEDISDVEWTVWYKTLWYLLPLYIAHFVMGRLLEKTAPEWRNSAYLLFTVTYLLLVFGWKILLLFVTHGCIFFLAVNFGSVTVVWVSAFILMWTIHADSFSIKSLLSTSDNKEHIFIVTAELVSVNLKCISFCLEKVRHKTTLYNCTQSQDDKTSGEPFESIADVPSEIGALATIQELADMFQYVFYFPLFFNAPLVSYNTFCTQINERPGPLTKRKLLEVIIGFLRIAFWAFFVNVCLHYMYFSALLFNSHILNRVSRWTLMGICYFEGQFKMVKYLVFFGLAGQLARLDGVDVPGLPICVSWVYRYSTIWKYFDRGMYNFSLRYIYIPLGGSKAGLLWKIFGSFLCFMFFYTSYGLDLQLFVCCIINFDILVLEICGSALEKTSLVQQCQTRYLSPLLRRRIYALLLTPVTCVSMFSIFYFFAGEKSGNVIIYKMFTKGTRTSFFLVYFIVYCMIQVGMEIEGRKARSSKQKTD